MMFPLQWLEMDRRKEKEIDGHYWKKSLDGKSGCWVSLDDMERDRSEESDSEDVGGSPKKSNSVRNEMVSWLVGICLLDI